MLHLADAFGVSDTPTGAALDINLSDKNHVLIDLGDSRLKFTPKDLAAAVKGAANEILRAFHQELDSHQLLSVRQRSIAIILPQGAGVAVTFLGVAALSMIGCPMTNVLSKHEYIYTFESLNIDLLVVTEGNPGAVGAAQELKIPTAYFKWWFDPEGNEPPLPIITRSGRTEPYHKLDFLSVSPREFEICLRVHTTGTTHKPKVVNLSHRNVVVGLANLQKTYSWVGLMGESDTILSLRDLASLDVGYCVAPLCHVHGLIAGCLAPLGAQSCVVIPEHGFDPALFWTEVIEHKCTWTSLTPNMLDELVEWSEANLESIDLSLSKLKFIRVTSGFLPLDVHHKAESMFKVPILEAYSVTECTHQVTSSGVPKFEDRIPGSVGKPTGTEVCVLVAGTKQVAVTNQSGEIWVRGHTVITAYGTEKETGEEESGAEVAATSTPSANLGRKAAEEEHFLLHSQIKWFCQGGPPAFISTAVDLAPTTQRTFTSRAPRTSTVPAVVTIGTTELPPVAEDEEVVLDGGASSVGPLSCHSPAEGGGGSPAGGAGPDDGSPQEQPQISYPRAVGRRSGSSFSLAPRPRLMRFASALEPYFFEDEFKESREPLVSQLPPMQLWFKTGDTGYIDDGGFLHVIARSQDVINHNGIKVSPYEIERCVAALPEVQKCAVFGVPDRRQTEVVYCAVVLNPEVKELTSELVASFKNTLKEKLAFYKIPSQFVEVESLPVDDNGRLQKDQLTKQYTPPDAARFLPLTRVAR